MRDICFKLVIKVTEFHHRNHCYIFCLLFDNHSL